MTDIKKEWDTVLDAFQQLLDKFREPGTIPLTSTCNTCTSIFFTTHYSTSPGTHTITSHTHLHTLNYHCAGTTTSSKSMPNLGQTALTTIPTTILTTTSVSIFAIATFPRKPPPKKIGNLKKPACIAIQKMPTNIGHFRFHRH